MTRRKRAARNTCPSEQLKMSEQLQLSRRAIKFLFSLGRPHVMYLYLVLNSILENAMPYIPIYFSARLIDALCEGSPIGELVLLVSLTVGTVFLCSLLHAWLSAGQEVATDEIYRNQEWGQSEKAMEMSYASVEDAKVTALRARINKESQTGYNLWVLSESTKRLISSATRIVMSLSLTLSFFLLDEVSPVMKCALVGGILLTILCGMITNRKVEKANEKFMADCVQENMFSGKYYQYIEHYTSGKDIRIYDMAENLLALNAERMDQFHKKYWNTNLRVSGLQAINLVANHILRFGVYLIVICAALSGQITVGFIAQYVSCIILLMAAVSEMVSAIQRYLVNNQYLKRYFSYLDLPNPMYKGSLTVEKRDDNEYFVEFRDVSFRYPNTEVYVLRHVNMRFKVGEKLAIVGRNGSGKTTFIKLLCRLYDPTEGEILLNGVNIQKYDYEEYMSIFSIVFQDFKLFAFGLGQNVAAGPIYDGDKVKKCLTQAGFGERLASMPEGMESYLYKAYDGSGIEISGGEAQKVALARALYKDAPFMILDEPTSALDPVSEYEVYSSFNEIAGDRTAIYISHRLASCRFCDEIAVFDQGQIVQMGSHGELLSQKDGKYYELWEAQAQYYTD